LAAKPSFADPTVEAAADGVAPLTQDRLAALRQRAGSPALAAMARGPGGALALVDGVRKAGIADRATTDDLWHLGSITKSMTATLVATVVETGRLSWTTTVGEALAEVAPEMRDEYRAATVLDLLSHRSGLPANIPMLSFIRYPREEADPRESRRRYAAECLAQAPVGPRGETFTYSNSGFVLAGLIL
jgi:CubicO group peptidase (beta-lactamase class C family)